MKNYLVKYLEDVVLCRRNATISRVIRVEKFWPSNFFVRRIARLMSILMASAMPLSIMAADEEFKCPADSNPSSMGGDRYCTVMNDTIEVYHGPYWSSHPNGKLSRIMNYDRGSPVGQIRQWSEEGIIVKQGQFLDGSPSGVWRHFYPNGKLQHVINFSSPFGSTQSFSASGKRMAEGQFYDGAKLGAWMQWNEEGKVIAKCDFGRGQRSVTGRECQQIAENLEPPGVSKPVPLAVQIGPGLWRLDIEGACVQVIPPTDWQSGAQFRGVESVMFSATHMESTVQEELGLDVKIISLKGGTLMQLVESNLQEDFAMSADLSKKSVNLPGVRPGNQVLGLRLTFRPIHHINQNFSQVLPYTNYEQRYFWKISDNYVMLVRLHARDRRIFSQALEKLNRFMNTAVLLPSASCAHPGWR